MKKFTLLFASALLLGGTLAFGIVGSESRTSNLAIENTPGPTWLQAVAIENNPGPTFIRIGDSNPLA